MKVLVTGAYGQLGREIERLSVQFSLFHFIFTDADTLDISNEESVRNFFDEIRPAYVINCAAYTAVDKAESEVEAARSVNAVAPMYLARYSKRSGARLLHISTDYVFDGMNSTPYNEEVLPSPATVYGQTKLEGEQNLLKENRDSIVIRTSWLYSAYGNNFVKTIRKLAAERGELKVVSDQVGAPTYAADLAEAILKILSDASENPISFIPGIYHYSNEGAISWYDFAKAIVELSGLNCRVNPVRSSEFPTVAKRPKFSVLDKSKIKETFGIQIPNWKESLNNCLQTLS